jgi:hypothetical protein
MVRRLAVHQPAGRVVLESVVVAIAVTRRWRGRGAKGIAFPRSRRCRHPVAEVSGDLISAAIAGCKSHWMITRRRCTGSAISWQGGKRRVGGIGRLNILNTRRGVRVRDAERDSPCSAMRRKLHPWARNRCTSARHCSMSRCSGVATYWTLRREIRFWQPEVSWSSTGPARRWRVLCADEPRSRARG